jgi:hypothetical protein
MRPPMPPRHALSTILASPEAIRHAPQAFVVAPIVIAALALSEYYLSNRSIADLPGSILPKKVGGTILKPGSVKPAHFSGSAA